MSACNLTTPIDRDQCIGDSRSLINTNFDNLDTAVCTLSSREDLTGFRNKLINAQGTINQRAYAGAATTTAKQYTVDRWRVVTLGETLGVSQVENVITFTAPVGGVEQVIEGGNLETGTYILSWTGTALAYINGTPIANGGTVALTGGTNATVKFANGTFKWPQLEKGTRVSSFESRPYQLELMLCERYYALGHYYESQDVQNTYYTNPEYTNEAWAPFRVTMRATPSAGLTWANVGHGPNIVGMFVRATTIYGVQVAFTTHWPQDSAPFFHFYADAEITT